MANWSLYILTLPLKLNGGISKIQLELKFFSCGFKFLTRLFFTWEKTRWEQTIGPPSILLNPWETSNEENLERSRSIVLEPTLAVVTRTSSLQHEQKELAVEWAIHHTSIASQQTASTVAATICKPLGIHLLYFAIKNSQKCLDIIKGQEAWVKIWTQERKMTSLSPAHTKITKKEQS